MTNAFRMTIGAPVDRGEIAKANAAFAQFAELHAVPPSVRRSLQIALDELLSNTIRYGFEGEGKGKGKAIIEAEVDHHHVILRLTDDGRPFDPFGVTPPDASLPLAKRRVGGLGIQLVRGLMDEVSYERRGGHNVVVLTKLLSGGR
jgi:serine/threonine-protein kinase RsbW